MICDSFPARWMDSVAHQFPLTVSTGTQDTEHCSRSQYRQQISHTDESQRLLQRFVVCLVLDLVWIRILMWYS